MTTAKKPTTDFDEQADVMQAPEDWEWETVAEETPTQVIFETPGDTFIGQYNGVQHVERELAADGTDQSFELFIFLGRDGVRYSVNRSYSLNEAMEDIRLNDWVRITYVKDVPTGRKLNPMKDFRVDVRRG